MNYYTSPIPLTLAEKLKEKGMEMETLDEDGNLWIEPDYSMVFDWLMNKGYYIIIIPHCGGYIWNFSPVITDTDTLCTRCTSDWQSTWHKAAGEAIEKALTLI